MSSHQSHSQMQPDHIPSPQPTFPAGDMNPMIPPLSGGAFYPRPHTAFPMPLGQDFPAIRQPSLYYNLPEQDVMYSQSHLEASGVDQFTAAHQTYRACVPYPAISSLSKRWYDRGSGRFGWPSACKGPSSPFLPLRQTSRQER